MELIAKGEGLITAIKLRIRERVWDREEKPVTLTEIADDFDMSPATLKRKLHKHHTSFQQLLDDIRKQAAIHLITRHGMNNQEVASYLQFHDVRNFRRAFKRWTGVTPTGIKCS